MSSACDEGQPQGAPPEGAPAARRHVHGHAHACIGLGTPACARARRTEAAPARGRRSVIADAQHAAASGMVFSRARAPTVVTGWENPHERRDETARAGDGRRARVDEKTREYAEDRRLARHPTEMAGTRNAVGVVRETVDYNAGYLSPNEVNADLDGPPSPVRGFAQRLMSLEASPTPRGAGPTPRRGRARTGPRRSRAAGACRRRRRRRAATARFAAGGTARARRRRTGTPPGRLRATASVTSLIGVSVWPSGRACLFIFMMSERRAQAGVLVTWRRAS